jgi:hypothetical protein
VTITDPATWLLMVAAAHLGFQATVDLVVYPALADVPASEWAEAHQRHSRRITPVVAVIYPALVVLVVWTLLAEPRDTGAWLAFTGGLLSVVTTAAVAAPTHGRLGGSPPQERPQLLRRLDQADRVRTVGALVCLVGSLLLVA